jgi:hypothetical protein
MVQSIAARRDVKTGRQTKKGTDLFFYKNKSVPFFVC